MRVVLLLCRGWMPLRTLLCVCACMLLCSCAMFQRCAGMFADAVGDDHVGNSHRLWRCYCLRGATVAALAAGHPSVAASCVMSACSMLHDHRAVDELVAWYGALRITGAGGAAESSASAPRQVSAESSARPGPSVHTLGMIAAQAFAELATTQLAFATSHSPSWEAPRAPAGGTVLLPALSGLVSMSAAVCVKDMSVVIRQFAAPLATIQALSVQACATLAQVQASEDVQVRGDEKV